VAKKLVVFVHGWSVRSTDTYGQLPQRLRAEAGGAGLDLNIQHVFLGKYVSFRDEVRLEDISRALHAALQRESGIQEGLTDGERMVLITHSTGGPVARDWWHRYYVSRNLPCPMSHLVMLAPANFGSALAKLGKGKVSRLKSWVKGVEPGQRVLDWLELGSPESWALNESWVRQQPVWSLRKSPVFQFVLAGQTIDRSLYDHLNSYTDEQGSDGVVRVASANLNATYVQLVQEADEAAWKKGDWTKTKLVPKVTKNSPRCAMAVLPRLAHSGKDKGILRSVRMNGEHPTVTAILRCLSVGTDAQYAAVCDEFERSTAETQRAERDSDVETRLFQADRVFVRPLTTQFIARLQDEKGYPLEDFDLVLTGWDPEAENPAHRSPDPNLLPEGFFIDRQLNTRHRGTVTYYLNAEAMKGAKALGVRILPRPAPDPADKKRLNFVVHYVQAEFAAPAKTLAAYLKPNQTLMLDIVMKRVVREGVFRLEQVTDLSRPKDFTKDPPGPPIVD
jgi:hypothetical protein